MLKNPGRCGMTPLFKKKTNKKTQKQMSCKKEENISKVKLSKNQHACVSQSTDANH